VGKWVELKIGSGTFCTANFCNERPPASARCQRHHFELERRPLGSALPGVVAPPDHFSQVEIIFTDNASSDGSETVAREQRATRWLPMNPAAPVTRQFVCMNRAEIKTEPVLNVEARCRATN